MNVPPLTHEEPGDPTLGHPKPGDPTVSVFIDGLSLICFSEKNKRAETAFIDCGEKYHPFRMRIFKKDCTHLFWDSDKFNPLPCENPLPPAKPGNLYEKSIITINTQGTGMGKRYESADAATKDDKDIRWIVDLDALHKDNIPIAANAEDSIYSRLYIKDGVFYTRFKSKKAATVFNTASPMDPPSINDYVGRVIGVAVGGEEVLIEIKLSDGTLMNIPPLKKADGPYLIHIRYKCTGSDGAGDFLLNYKLLQPPTDGKKFDIKFEPGEDYWNFCDKDTAVAEACQGTVVGGGSKEFPPDDSGG